MAEDLYGNYKQTYERLNKACSRCQEYRNVIREVCERLEEPANYWVAGVPVPFLAEVHAIGGPQPLMARDWPDAKDLAEALSEIHKIFKELKSQYNNLPNKKSVKEPPDTIRLT